MFDINQPVQSQTKARSLNFWIYVGLELYYPCSKNKGTDPVAKTKALISFAVTANLICAFIFARRFFSFSQDTAHILCMEMLT